MRSAACALLVVSLSFLVVLGQGKSVILNEVLAFNSMIFADEEGDFEDWIELRNPTVGPINLDGYTLTDDPDDPRKWTFPAVTIDPGEFLVIWASGKNRRRPGTWSFSNPLSLEFESGGFHDGNVAQIRVNGKERSLNLRGLNIVRLNEQGNHVESTVYDTWESSDAADSLVRYLDRLSRGEILIVAVKDEASGHLSPAARAALAALGSEHVAKCGEWDSWGMISVVGQGKLVEDYRPSGEGAAVGSLVSKMTLHTSFRIDKDGDYLGLYAPDGTVVDSLSFAEQVRDVSIGRLANGSAIWHHFAEPTPGAPNNTPPADGIAEPPQSILGSGFYRGTITVALSTMTEKATICYTLDGSLPTEGSPRYAAPLILDTTQVLHARAFKQGLIPSSIMTYTFFINEAVHLPVLSLTTDPVNMWDKQIGIYTVGLDPARPNFAQRGREWERPVTVEFFEEGGALGFALDAGIRIFGHTTREFPNKSFILYFRKTYGPGHLEYQVFKEKDINSFSSLVVRNGGNDGEGSLPRMRDALMHALWAEEGGLVSAKRSVVVYLNGRPWGIYNLREHIDRDYIASNYQIDDCDLVTEEKTVKTGDAVQWDATLSFFESQDLRLEDNYAKVQQLIDIKNFTDYQIFQIYSGNIDVWGNYVRFRPRIPEGKWRWIMWDMDLTFGLETDIPVSHDSLAWHTRDNPRPDLGSAWADGDLWLTVMLRKLLEKEGYRTYFINRFADLLNATLHPTHVIAKIDSFASVIEPDVPLLKMTPWRSDLGFSLDEWKANVEELRDFARQRPDYVRQHIIGMFGLVGTAGLVIAPPVEGKGSVPIGTVLPDSYPWHGTYFQGVPVTLQAKPAPGYEFVGWNDPTFPQTPVVTALLPEQCTVQALFAPFR